MAQRHRSRSVFSTRRPFLRTDPIGEPSVSCIEVVQSQRTLCTLDKTLHFSIRSVTRDALSAFDVRLSPSILLLDSAPDAEFHRK